MEEKKKNSSGRTVLFHLTEKDLEMITVLEKRTGWYKYEILRLGLFMVYASEFPEEFDKNGNKKKEKKRKTLSPYAYCKNILKGKVVKDSLGEMYCEYKFEGCEFRQPLRMLGKTDKDREESGGM